MHCAPRSAAPALDRGGCSGSRSGRLRTAELPQRDKSRQADREGLPGQRLIIVIAFKENIYMYIINILGRAAVHYSRS